MAKYRIWVDREGSPKIIELKEELAESELDALVAQFREVRTNRTLMVLSSDWEVAVL